MLIFPVIVSKLRLDITDDKEVIRDWDFPFIHCTINSDSSCLETSVRMVYCATFDCNANSSKNTVTCSWFRIRISNSLLLKIPIKTVAGIGATIELTIHIQFLSATNRITKVQNP